MFSPFDVAPSPRTPEADAWRCPICDYVHEGDAPPESCPVCGAERGLFEAQVPASAGASAGVGEGEIGRIVIVGAGIAGVTAAEQAREASAELEIALVSKEQGLPYYRLNLTRFLAGELDDQSLALQPAQWFEKQRINLIEGEVASIDRESRRVVLRDGAVLPYDRLILANGAHAFVPPLPGVTRDGVFTLRTLEQSRQILGHAKEGTRCVVIGGGLLGLEAAGALTRRGAWVTVLEGFDWLLPRQLAEPAGRLLQQHLEQQAIVIRCGVRVAEITGDEDVRAVRLDDDEEIPADLVILSTGVRPNSYLARQNGIEVNKGIIVDDHLTTSDPSILAAGDVTEHRGVLYGLWPAAYAQGFIAGANAAGGSLEFSGLPLSSRLKVSDVDLFSIGQFTALDGSYVVIEEQTDAGYYRIVCRDGRITGANLYGDTELASALKTAIEEGTQVAELGALLERFPRLAKAS